MPSHPIGQDGHKKGLETPSKFKDSESIFLLGSAAYALLPGCKLMHALVHFD
jgi:hypothetical protein